jgi:hypothetical protein
VLAGIEETFQAKPAGEVQKEMKVIQTLLTGMFDYAGLYPPANIGLRAAVGNYLEYSRSKHAWALGRFIVNLDRLEEFHSIASDSLQNFKLSVIACEDADFTSLPAQIGAGLAINSVEIKSGDRHVIERIAKTIPLDLETYFEVPMNAVNQPALKTIRDAGARAKLRMGGVVREAIPTDSDVLRTLNTLSILRLSFKATAGLHHPLRSTQPLTYQPQSPTAAMHGFLNLAVAAALLYFGGSVDEAELVLAEEGPAAWRVSEDALHWRDHTWTIEQLATLRSRFFMSIGSCSFEEPIHDLESLGWL